MSSETSAFAPLYLSTRQGQVGTFVASVTIAATDAASADTALPGQQRGGQTAFQIVISNTATTSWAYVSVGVAGAVATPTVATSYPVAPGSKETITVADEVSGVRVILGTAAATGNVIFTRGTGL
jgi:hypothetical protein